MRSSRNRSTTFSEKLAKIAVYHDLGEISPNPSPSSVGHAKPLSIFLWAQGSAMEILVKLAVTGTKCIKNRQTNILYIYIDRKLQNLKFGQNLCKPSYHVTVLSVHIYFFSDYLDYEIELKRMNDVYIEISGEQSDLQR